MTSSGTPTVFIIDDDAAVRASIQDLLESLGLRSESFETAEQFLRSKRSDGPSCLVLDVRLPGVNGLDLQRRLADAGFQIPVIFITGHGDIPMTVKAMKSGAVEFLTKPFLDRDLLDAIHQALERDQATRQQRSDLAELRERYETLTAREREICARLGPALRERGLLFVGIDVIDGYLTEINVTSPTGIRAVKRLGGPDIAAAIWEKIEKRIANSE